MQHAVWQETQDMAFLLVVSVTLSLFLTKYASEAWTNASKNATIRPLGMTDFDRTLTSFYMQDELAE